MEFISNESGGADHTRKVPVLIVGGGGCGLASSIFLSDCGVDHILIERHPGTAIVPKAFSYTQRTMEVLRQHGVADAVYASGPRPEESSSVVYYTSLLGSGELDRRKLYSQTFLGLDEPDREVHMRDSPCRCGLLPQWDLEPLLKGFAEERIGEEIRFGHELVGIEDRGDYVWCSIKPPTGDTYEVEAAYVIAADGGRTVGPAVGISLPGPTALADMVSIIFEAKLGPLLPEDNAIIYFFLNPEGGPYSSGVLTPQPKGVGPNQWGRNTTQWRINVRFGTGDAGSQLDHASAADLVRQLLHAEDLDVKVSGVSHWVLEGVLADSFRSGRVYVAGDAAHRQPPTTGLGLNAGIQDAHNLAWKLAAVLHGQADESLLDTYENERRPVDGRQMEWALYTFNNLSRTLVAGLGLGAEMTLNERQKVFQALLADTPDGRTRRALMREVWATQRIEFNPHDIDLGYCYDTDAAICPDGAEPPPRDPMGVNYAPTTKPGHRLPHAWLKRPDGLISTLDLIPPGQFALLAGELGQRWVEAAVAVADDLRVPIHGVRIGASGALEDQSGHWRRLREVSESGAILVRPDGFVAWRTDRLPGDPVGVLRSVLCKVLGRREAAVQ